MLASGAVLFLLSCTGLLAFKYCLDFLVAHAIMCSIGKMPDVSSVCSSKPFKRRRDFNQLDWSLLKYRCNNTGLKSVCQNHEITYFKIFLIQNKYCCDPKNLHPGINKKLKQRVSLSLSKKTWGTLNPSPGEGLCAKCYLLVLKDYKDVSTPLPSDESDKSQESNDSNDSDNVTTVEKEGGEISLDAEAEGWSENPLVDISPSPTVDFPKVHLNSYFNSFQKKILLLTHLLLMKANYV